MKSIPIRDLDRSLPRPLPSCWTIYPPWRGKMLGLRVEMERAMIEAMERSETCPSERE